MSQPTIAKGFDFTSAPKWKKPITCAHGRLTPDLLQIERIDCLADFEQFEAELKQPGPWIAGFDFLFSLPKIFVEQVGWPLHWQDMVARLAEMGREAFESTIRNYCAGKPPGSKHPRRATDVAANSRSPLMLDYTPVGKMFFQGAYRLGKSGVVRGHEACWNGVTPLLNDSDIAERNSSEGSNKALLTTILT